MCRYVIPVVPTVASSPYQPLKTPAESHESLWFQRQIPYRTTPVPGSVSSNLIRTSASPSIPNLLMSVSPRRPVPELSVAWPTSFPPVTIMVVFPSPSPDLICCQKAWSATSPSYAKGSRRESASANTPEAMFGLSVLVWTPGITEETAAFTSNPLVPHPYTRPMTCSRPFVSNPYFCSKPPPSVFGTHGSKR